jgi:hypothetical protein
MAVYSSSQEVATSDNAVLSGNVVKPRQTEYVYVQNQGGGGGGGGRFSWNPGPARPSTVPKGVPRFLGNKGVIFGAWGIAIAVVSWDEWFGNSILPRPARLWATTMLFAILAIISTIDAVTPLANALALGYAFYLLYKQFSGGNDGN